MAGELSIFADESGDRGGKARYYLLTLVFHDQSDDIMREVGEYESRLAAEGLPGAPFHSEPLLNGHKDYEALDIVQRKRMLVLFSAFVRRLPVSTARVLRHLRLPAQRVRGPVQVGPANEA